MKKIKVIVEIRKEDFEKEIVNYMEQGFKIEQTNIAYAENPLISKENIDIEINIKMQDTLSRIVNDNKIKELKNLNYHIIYYAIMIKDE